MRNYITNTLSYQQNGRNVQSVITIEKIADTDKVIGYAPSEINLDFCDNIRKRVKPFKDHVRSKKTMVNADMRFRTIQFRCIRMSSS